MFVLNEERGQGLVEYALILALVALVIIIILSVFGGQTGNLFSRITSAVP